MNKLKTPLLILVTIIVLIACASLPAIAAAVQDNATVNNSCYSEMQSVELDFSEERQQMPILAKLALIRDGSFLAVSPASAVLPHSQMEHIVRNALSLYYEAELIPYNWTNYEFSAVPYLVSNPSDTESFAIFWVVSIHWPDSTDDLQLYVDDETCLILYLHFTGNDALDTYSAWGYLETLSNAYLKSTNISGILADPEVNGVKDITYDDSGLRVDGDKYYVVTIRHNDYGTLNLEFYLCENGFYLMIV